MAHLGRRIAIAVVALGFGATALGAAPTDRKTASDLPGIASALVHQLPSPEKSDIDEFCQHDCTLPGSGVDKPVAGLGWIATRSARRTLGTAAPIGGGPLRVWDGDGPGASVGPVQGLDGTSRFQTVVVKRKACAGKALVPDIRGQPISQARKILVAKGWTPVRPREPPDTSDRASVLAKHGIPEAGSCSDSYCVFNYRAATGRLSVSTVGDIGEDGSSDRVVDYDTTCF